MAAGYTRFNNDVDGKAFSILAFLPKPEQYLKRFNIKPSCINMSKGYRRNFSFYNITL